MPPLHFSWVVALFTFLSLFSACARKEISSYEKREAEIKKNPPRKTGQEYHAIKIPSYPDWQSELRMNLGLLKCSSSPEVELWHIDYDESSSQGYYSPVSREYSKWDGLDSCPIVKYCTVYHGDGPVRGKSSAGFRTDDYPGKDTNLPCSPIRKFSKPDLVLNPGRTTVCVMARWKEKDGFAYAADCATFGVVQE